MLSESQTQQEAQSLTLSHVLLIEDEPLFQQFISKAVYKIKPDCQIISCLTGAEALGLFNTEGMPTFDLILIDLGLPDMSGLDLIRCAHNLYPETPVMVISTFSSDEAVISAIQAGAQGYFLKANSIESISSSIDELLKGNYPISPSLAHCLFKLARASDLESQVNEHSISKINLSPREKETLKYVSQGYSYQEVADLMHIALSTVQSHIRVIYRKLESKNQMQAVQKARNEGLI